jgi:hypothetical protein
MDQMSGLESLLRREGITTAHSIIKVDHLGKGSSLPINISIHQEKYYSNEKKKGKKGLRKRNLCSEKEI